jgi:cation transport ATPase
MTRAEQEKMGVTAELNRKQELVQRHERLVREQKALVSATEDELKKREQQLILERAARIQKEAEAEELQKRIEQAEASRTASDEALKQLASEHGSLTSAVRFTLAALVLVSGSILLVYVQARWLWLSGHTHRLGITLCAALVFAGISWSIADKNSRRRNTVLVAVVIASIVTLIQVIDSEPRRPEELSPPMSSATP